MPYKREVRTFEIHARSIWQWLLDFLNNPHIAPRFVWDAGVFTNTIVSSNVSMTSLVFERMEPMHLRLFTLHLALLRPHLFSGDFFLLLSFLGLIDNTTAPSSISQKHLRCEAKAEAVLNELDANGEIMSHYTMKRVEQSQGFPRSSTIGARLSCLRSLDYALDDSESNLKSVRGNSEDKK